MATKFTANAHFRWCAVSTDVYLLFSVKETGTGFEETFCGTVYKFEPGDDPTAQDEWGVVVRRGAEHCDDTESFASVQAATSRIKDLLDGVPAVLRPMLA